MNPPVVCIFGPNAIGKSTQAPLLQPVLQDIFGTSCDWHETRDLIVARLPEQSGLDEETLDDGTVIDLHNEAERFRTGKFSTPVWVTALVCAALEESVSERHSVLFSGSPRTISEAWAVHDSVFALQQEERLGPLVIIRLQFPYLDGREDFRIGRKRLEEKGVVDSYKLEQFDRRVGWYIEHTLPSFELLRHSQWIMQETFTVEDDGTRTPEAIHEEIVGKLERVIRGGS